MSLFWVRRPHVPLLVLLVAMVAALPLVEVTPTGRCVLNAAALIGVVFSIGLVHRPRRDVWMVAATGLFALAAEIAHEAGVPAVTALAYVAAQGGFYACAAMIMIRYMLRDSRATVDEMFAAAAAFLLMVLAWASAYWIIEDRMPGAFAIANPTTAGQISWVEFVYFSMTTLSTTGYGDMSPASDGARATVMLEQFVGVMYVALVISRLAGFSGRRRREN